MATLTIRNLSDKIRDRLRLRAAKNGVSMEAEARAILGDAVQGRAGHSSSSLSVAELQDWVAVNRKRLRSHKNDTQSLIRDRRRETILEVIRDGRAPAEVFGDEYRRVLSEADWTEDQVRGFKRPSQ